CFHGPLRRTGVPQVSRDRDRLRPPWPALDRLDRLLRLDPPATVPDRHARARLRQQQRRRPPDAPPPTSDKRALPRERDHGPSLLRIADCGLRILRAGWIAARHLHLHSAIRIPHSAI